MEGSETIRISAQAYKELTTLAGVLSERLKKRVSVDDALENLLAHTPRTKPSDYAGAWVMSEEEAEKLKVSLKELWRTWKTD
jgi:predicted CopG family antitoxin